MTSATDLPLLAARPGSAAKILGISRARIYQLLADGRIRARKADGMTLIEYSELQRFLADLPTATFGGADATA